MLPFGNPQSSSTHLPGGISRFAYVQLCHEQPIHTHMLQLHSGVPQNVAQLSPCSGTMPAQGRAARSIHSVGMPCPQTRRYEQGRQAHLEEVRRHLGADEERHALVKQRHGEHGPVALVRLLHQRHGPLRPHNPTRRLRLSQLPSQVESTAGLHTWLGGRHGAPRTYTPTAAWRCVSAALPLPPSISIPARSLQRTPAPPQHGGCGTHVLTRRPRV
jgi:hypothetical protein